MITAFKLKPVLGFLLVLVLGVAGSYLFVSLSNNKVSASGTLNYTIVLDAGHGGIDGGCEGVNTRITEAEINLKVTKKLEKLLTGFGFNVVLTRKDAGGLYSITSSNKKQDDMRKRKELISKTKPNMVVSVHMNSYINSYEKGAQVFYLINDQQGKSLANNIQNELVKHLSSARENSNHADLYILQCFNCPSVVVEGGFLSNPQDEALLITDDYQSKLAYGVFCGIVKYFEQATSQNVAWTKNKSLFLT